MRHPLSVSLKCVLLHHVIMALISHGSGEFQSKPRAAQPRAVTSPRMPISDLHRNHHITVCRHAAHTTIITHIVYWELYIKLSTKVIESLLLADKNIWEVLATLLITPAEAAHNQCNLSVFLSSSPAFKTFIWGITHPCLVEVSTKVSKQFGEGPYMLNTQDFKHCEFT